MMYYHTIWDDAQSPFVKHWLPATKNLKAFDINTILKECLGNYPQDLIAMRSLQGYVAHESAREAVCREHQRLAKQETSNVNY